MLQDKLTTSPTGGREYLLDIYWTIAKALGKEKQPTFAPERLGDIKHSNADVSKARKLLGYEGKWSLEMGIREAIAWYVQTR
jgi:UDP-N-acetylglucosamine/UDP-N-acetylgalactosamine 4-epimerase